MHMHRKIITASSTGMAPYTLNIASSAMLTRPAMSPPLARRVPLV